MNSTWRNNKLNDINDEPLFVSTEQHSKRNSDTHEHTSILCFEATLSEPQEGLCLTLLDLRGEMIPRTSFYLAFEGLLLDFLSFSNVHMSC